jgi:hypothetical protein
LFAHGHYALNSVPFKIFSAVAAGRRRRGGAARLPPACADRPACLLRRFTHAILCFMYETFSSQSSLNTNRKTNHCKLAKMGAEINIKNAKKN